MQGPLPPPRRILLLPFLCESGHKGWLCYTSFLRTCVLWSAFMGQPTLHNKAPWPCLFIYTLWGSLSVQIRRFFNSNLERGSRINRFCHFWEQDWLVKPQPGQNRFHSRRWHIMVSSCLPRIRKRDATIEDKIWTFFDFPCHKLGCKHCPK